MNTVSEAAGPTTNPTAGFDSVHAGRTWVVVARALTAQAPPWNYVGTPLRLRRRKRIYPKKPTWDLAFASGVYRLSLRDMCTTTRQALPVHTIPLAFSDMGSAFGDFVDVCDCAPKGAAWGTPSGFP